MTGLALFTRPLPPTAVAVNLDLGRPRPDRPWAVRASVRLTHPGSDGLASHVPEVERLAVVGKAIVDRAGGLFAAAVTTAGVRTWLAYAATDAIDLTDVGQPDYPTTVEITSDPTWDGHRALCPTPAEAAEIVRRRAESAAVATARSATHAAVQSLRSAGTDLSRPSPVRYAVTLPPGEAAAFAERATATGLRPDGDGRFVRDDLPDLALILRTERWLIREAARAGGRYDGWAAVA